jgi:hypothetical protein
MGWLILMVAAPPLVRLAVAGFATLCGIMVNLSLDRVSAIRFLRSVGLKEALDLKL